MLKLSSFMQEAAKKVAQKMLDSGATEMDIPQMPNFRVSTSSTPPDGYVLLGDVSLGGKKFNVFQMF